jgi:hypothetical protein
MTIYAADGTTKLSKSALQAKVTTVPSTKVTVNEDIYQAYNYDPYRDNFKTFEGERRKLFAAGQVVDQSQLDFLYPTATIASISPATGAAAGGTAVTIKGTHFAGATGATVGGGALTTFKVVNDSTITGVTASHATGVVDVVVNDDAGNVTATGAYTYV